MAYLILILIVGLCAGPILLTRLALAWRSRFIEPQDHIWKLDVQPSLFYSGCWADPQKWGEQPEVYDSYYQAYWAGRRYVAKHPYGAVNIKHKPRATV